MIELNGKTRLTTEVEKALAKVAGYNPNQSYDQKTLGKMIATALTEFKKADPQGSDQLMTAIAEQLLDQQTLAHPDSDRIVALAAHGLSEAEIWDRLYGPDKTVSQLE